MLTHFGPVPATDLDWTAMGALIGIGVVAAEVGLATFHRRDLIASWEPEKRASGGFSTKATPRPASESSKVRDGDDGQLKEPMPDARHVVGGDRFWLCHTPVF